MLNIKGEKGELALGFERILNMQSKKVCTLNANMTQIDTFYFPWLSIVQLQYCL